MGQSAKSPAEAGPWKFGSGKLLILVFQRVSNGDSIAVYPRTAEFKVVVDEVEVRFRPNEDAVGYVKTKSATNVHEKMVAALEVSAAGKRAGEEWLIKTEALQPDATLQICLNLLSQGWTIHGVEIIKDRPVGVEENVHILMGPPRYFSANAEVFFDKQEVAAKSWIAATTNALWSVVRVCKTI